MILAETERFRFDTQMAIADLDVQRLVNERLRNKPARRRSPGAVFGRFASISRARSGGRPPRPLSALSFPHAVRPGDSARRASTATRSSASSRSAWRAVAAHRTRNGDHRRLGGLDSTLALLVIAKALDLAGLSREGIVAITMPGFGTTARTRSNGRSWPNSWAQRCGLSRSPMPCGSTSGTSGTMNRPRRDLRERAGARADADPDGCRQPGRWLQRRHRRSFRAGAGLVHLQRRPHVHVPRQRWRAEDPGALPGRVGGRCRVHRGDRRVLRDICATPITPELLPLDADGALAQKTEDTIGPYELHDFFLYYIVRFQFAPRKVFFGPPGLRRPLRSRADLALDASFLPAFLQPAVQALGDARWAEGRLGGAFAAWRLADAQRRQRGAVAGGGGGTAGEGVTEDKETRRQGDKETRVHGDTESRGHGDTATRGHGDTETRRRGGSAALRHLLWRARIASVTNAPPWGQTRGFFRVIRFSVSCALATMPLPRCLVPPARQPLLPTASRSVRRRGRWL